MIAALWAFLTMPLWGMTVWAWIVVTTPLWGVPALWLLYPIAIQYERAKMGQGWGWWLCLMFVVPALVIDVIVNWTSLAVIFGRPRWGEWTFSTHLYRICRLEQCWQRTTGWVIALILNLIAPSGMHILLPETESKP
jgi:hypothetical protein